MSNSSKPFVPASPIALSLACLMLAGCNQSRFPDFTTTGSVFGASKDTAYAHVLAERRPVQEAMVVMPLRAGAPLEVIQSRAGNGLKQRIVLKGDALSSGQNTIDVRMVVKRVWPKPKKEGIKTHSGSLAAIGAQMREALPGVSMRMSNEVNTNAYGPFGYALGRAPGNVRCLFGWQNVAGKGREPWGIFTKVSDRPELSVRVRICRADMNSEQLVTVLRRMRIDADPARLKTEQGVAWRAGEGTDIHSFGGASPQ
ncbi:MAG: cellulose biosynthesis protein BcsN, partial [Pseudomonadota bacterium]